jgi:glycosyltransferase involved in cell wall biosynthesis
MRMRLSVIVPARNEADVLKPCLESLIAQSEPGFVLGEDWELLLVALHCAGPAGGHCPRS